MTNNPETLSAWCQRVASIGVDVLVDDGLIQKADFEKAVSIVAEEVRIRLAIWDLPPLEP